ncbi:hypothetical protein ACEUZ9_000768 [Paracoccus litorisediminis]|uniref:hypothetical protein n=1 Tax=Paracoccus litorisediminis TaxID=2006130 RepID=UPI0037326C59
MEIFARLEVHGGRQILAELFSGDEGVQIRLRRDTDITVEAHLGPWPETDDGWDIASKALFETDLAHAAAELDRMALKATTGMGTTLRDEG